MSGQVIILWGQEQVQMSERKCSISTCHRKKPRRTGLTNERPNRMHYVKLTRYHFSEGKEYLVFQAVSVLEATFFKKSWIE